MINDWIIILFFSSKSTLIGLHKIVQFNGASVYATDTYFLEFWSVHEQLDIRQVVWSPAFL